MKLLLGLIIAVAISSCSNYTVYKQDFDVDESGWSYMDSLSFKFDIEDPNQNYNLLLNLKYHKLYSYSNIHFFVDVTDSENQVYRDTIECFMANPQGKWLGKSAGDYIEHQFMYRYNVNLPVKGEYQIVIQQAMRDTLLKRISSLGLELQEYNEVKR